MAYIKLFEKLQNSLCSTNFPTIYFKPKQIQIFETILNGLDVIAVLPTGYGKSCLFQLLPRMFCDPNVNEKGIVIVLSPLNSIMIDQINTLNKLNIKAKIFKDLNNCELKIPDLFPQSNETNDCSGDSSCESGCSNLIKEVAKDNKIPDDVKNGLLEILFSHPEALLSETGRKLLKSLPYQKRVVAIVIDEAHCIESWWVFSFFSFSFFFLMLLWHVCKKHTIVL